MAKQKIKPVYMETVETTRNYLFNAVYQCYNMSATPFPPFPV